MAEAVTPQSARPWLRPIAVVFALALLVRLVHLWQWQQWPLMWAPSMDAAYHDGLARQLVENGSLGKEPFYRAPGYPYFLGALYGLLGPSNQLTVRVVQMLLGSLSCVLIFLLGQRVADGRVGLAAGLMAALYGPEVYFEGELQLPVLEVLLSSAMLLCVVSALRADATADSGRRATYWWLAGGLSLGLGAITRPNLLAYVPVLALWLCLALGWRRGLARSGLLLAMVAACVAPVTIRNRVVGGDNVLIASQGGVNLYIGNNPQSDGVTAVVPGTRATWWGGYNDTIAIAEEKEGRKLKPSEVSRYWSRQATAFMRSQPTHWLALMGRKTLLLLNGFELPNNEEVYPLRGLSVVLAALMWRAGPFSFPFGLVMPLALLGSALALHSRQRQLPPLILYVATYAATIILFFVNSRYRMPLLPGLLVLAAYGALALADMLRRPVRIAQAAKATGLLFAGLALCALPLPGVGEVDYAKFHTDLAAAYQQRGELPQAERELRQAIALEPSRPEGHIGLAEVLLDQKRYAEAQEAYAEVLRRWPQRADALAGRGDLALALEKRREALVWYEKAIAADPADHELQGKALDARGRMGSETVGGKTGGAAEARDDLLQQYIRERRYSEAAKLAAELRSQGDDSEGVLAAAAVAELNMGDLRAAAAAANELLSKNPKHPDGLLVLGVGLWQAGQIPQATEALRQAAQAAPRRSEVWSNLAAVLALGGDYERAKESCDKALALDAANTQALYVRAGCYLQRGEKARAAEDCRSILRIEPENEGAAEMLRQAEGR